MCSQMKLRSNKTIHDDVSTQYVQSAINTSKVIPHLGQTKANRPLGPYQGCPVVAAVLLSTSDKQKFATKTCR